METSIAPIDTAVTNPRQQHILQAAGELVVKIGYRAVTMKEVDSDTQQQNNQKKRISA